LIYEFVWHIFIFTSRSAAVPELWTAASYNTRQHMENETTDSTQRPTRNVFLRILFGFLWFVLLRIVTSGIIGAIVGGIAGAGKANPEAGFAGNFEAGANAGAQATMEFMHKYGLFVLLSQILLFVVLCYFRLLPGVGKYKKLRQT
jgi:hypothetical protein